MIHDSMYALKSIDYLPHKPDTTNHTSQRMNFNVCQSLVNSNVFMEVS